MVPPALLARCPAKLNLTLRVLGCRDFSRVDMMMDEGENPFVLEVNTIPGFTATSLLPKAAAKAGMNFSELVMKILDMALARRGAVDSQRSLQ